MSAVDDDEYRRSVADFAQYKGDPTRYYAYDDERTKALMPALHKAWHDYQTAQDVFTRVAKTYET